MVSRAVLPILPLGSGLPLSRRDAAAAHRLAGIPQNQTVVTEEEGDVVLGLDLPSRRGASARMDRAAVESDWVADPDQRSQPGEAPR